MFINFVGIDPIGALFWAAVLNGVVAVPLMAIIMLMAMQKRVIGRLPCHRRSGRGLIVAHLALDPFDAFSFG
jgi:hypothetical protein